MEESKDEILNLEETARMLKIGVVTARRWCKSGKLPAIKIGNHYRIRRKDIDRIFEEKLNNKNENKNEENNTTISF